LRDAAIGTGIAVDKILSLEGKPPTWQIANIMMPLPTDEERAERDGIHRSLDAIARKLNA
jgi:hypothetical protein